MRHTHYQERLNTQHHEKSLPRVLTGIAKYHGHDFLLSATYYHKLRLLFWQIHSHFCSLHMFIKIGNFTRLVKLLDLLTMGNNLKTYHHWVKKKKKKSTHGTLITTNLLYVAQLKLYTHVQAHTPGGPNLQGNRTCLKVGNNFQYILMKQSWIDALGTLWECVPVQCCDSIMVYVWLRFLEVATEGVSASLAQRLEPSSIMLSSECDGAS